MTSLHSSLHKHHNSLPRQALAWLLVMVMASLMGAWAWLLAALFFVAGAMVIHGLGVETPGWIGWLALLGMPLGAGIEIHLGWARSRLDFWKFMR